MGFIEFELSAFIYRKNSKAKIFSQNYSTSTSTSLQTLLNIEWRVNGSALYPFAVECSYRWYI